ncbi:MAG TPA: copper chaperone PCu(A)C [Alphaproteobacteria bacterium]|nr:copper chaperone PCu(A)C [Alphaproteobacteria bacterium]
MSFRCAALFVCAVVGTAAALSAHAAENGLKVSDAWMRVIVPLRPASGYFTLSNKTDHPYVLVGASSSGCGSLMLHQSELRNGQEHMAMVQAVLVPVHGFVKFSPGGYHLMCMKPTNEMKPGNSVPVTLTFKDGATVTADFQVHGPTGK